MIFSDLSFNNIEIIEGLDKLTKLEDLTLFNNRIARLENMDALAQLHVLSIGNNKLDQLENVSYGTCLKSVQPRYLVVIYNIAIWVTRWQLHDQHDANLSLYLFCKCQYR